MLQAAIDKFHGIKYGMQKKEVALPGKDAIHEDPIAPDDYIIFSRCGSSISAPRREKTVTETQKGQRI